MIEQDLLTFLSADAGVASVLGDEFDRFYPVTLPEHPKYPVLVYQRISAPPEGTLDSAFTTEARFQFSLFNRTYGEAKNAAAKVKAACADFRGDLAGRDPGNPDYLVAELQIADDRDGGFDPVALAYRVDVDVLVHYGGL